MRRPPSSAPPKISPRARGSIRESEWVLRGDLARALSTLPEGQREVVLLRYFEGLEEAEIAKSVGIPRGTVKSRLHHALRKMREALTGEAP